MRMNWRASQRVYRPIRDLRVIGAQNPILCRQSVAGAGLLFETVSRVCEGTSLIVTTNLPFEAWVEVMGSERLTGALLDRLTHRVHILEANGPSYRLREAKRRLRKQTSSRRKKS